MGQRMPEGAMPQPQGQGGGGGAAELAGNVSKGLEAMAAMVGNQFGPEAGDAIAQLQQQFQEIMMQISKQGAQGPAPAPGGQAGAAEAVPAGAPNMRQ